MLLMKGKPPRLPNHPRFPIVQPESALKFDGCVLHPP
jgi:hypothetical protein